MTEAASLASADFTESPPIAPTADTGSAAQGMVFRVRARDAAQDPKGPTIEARLGEAERLMGAGHHESAARIVQALALDGLDEGNSIRHIALRARVAAATADAAEVGRATWALTELAQTQAEAAFALAQIAGDRHAPIEVIGWLEAALQLSPKHEPSLLLAARTYRQIGKQDQAYAMLAVARTIEPPSVPARLLGGDMLQDDGKFDEAAAMYRDVLAIQPTNPSAIAGLIASRRADDDAGVIRKAELLIEANENAWQQRSTVSYSLAKLFDRVGDYEQAFRYASAANELVRRRHPHDAVAEDAHAERLLANLRQFADLELSGGDTGQVKPIFVVGMPRSGTTLLEQILGTHPHVTGLGELPFWPGLVHRWRMADADFAMPEVDRAVAAANRYRDMLNARGARDGYAVDKLPDNYRYVSLIAALLPDAQFVHVVRDPRDNMVSIFFEHFSPYHTYSTALASIVARRRMHDAVTAEWQARFPDRMMRVDYEATVRSGEPAVRALVERLGLEWTPQIMNYRDAARTVRTPSRHQVREQLYDTSIGRWHNYQPWMAEHFDAFSDPA